MKKLLLIILIAGLLLGGFIVYALGKQPVPSQRGTGSAIACSGKALPELTEGPYYKSGSPERQTIREATTKGTKLTLDGYVLDTQCQPIAHAWIDFWQADAQGKYDNSGYTLRGHQYTDQNGRYHLETIIPGIYPGRTEHIHFKIKVNEDSRVVTSQLFFPNFSGNDKDSIFDKSLIIGMSDAAGGNGKNGTYNFVVKR